jgi:hypothetical protein
MTQPMKSRGHLNPGATVTRHAAPTDLSDAVAHFWVPEWHLPPGHTPRQIVLSYPVLNLVVQPGAPEGGVALYGPRTTVSYRVLSGQGWALGALVLLGNGTGSLQAPTSFTVGGLAFWV